MTKPLNTQNESIILMLITTHPNYPLISKVQYTLEFYERLTFPLIVPILNVLVGANFRLILISSEFHTSFPSLS